MIRNRAYVRGVAALVFAVLGLAVAQVAGDTETDAEVQAAVEKATANPRPPVGGSRTAGAEGEVSLGSMRANYSHADISVTGTLGRVNFVRRYAMDTLGQTSDLSERPESAPFGSMKADALGYYRHAAPLQCSGTIESNCAGGMRWGHNFDSWVDYEARRRPCVPGDDLCWENPIFDLTWHVLTPDGEKLSFKACGLSQGNNQPPLPSCFARNHADNDVKLELLNGSSSGFGAAFVLHTPGGRFVYAEPWRDTPGGPAEPGWIRRRLSYVLSPEIEAPGCSLLDPVSSCQRRIATLGYGQACGAADDAVLGAGKTYVTSIEVAGGSKLWLGYDTVNLRDRRQMIHTLADGGISGSVVPQRECVLKQIWLTDAGESAPPTGATPVVSYQYAEGLFEQDAGTSTQVLGGLLEEVLLNAGHGAGTETRLRYEYVEPVLYANGSPSPQPLRTFRVIRNGVFERELIMDSEDGAYVNQSRSGNTKVNLWADNNGRTRSDGGVPYCHPGRFGTPSTLYLGDCWNNQTQHQQIETTMVGDGTGAQVPGVTNTAVMAVRRNSPHGPIRTSNDLQCSGLACSALAPDQRQTAWEVESFNPCRVEPCPPLAHDYFVFATKSVVDVRGTRTVYENALAPEGAGVPPERNGYRPTLPPVEVAAVKEGATLADGSDALLTRNFSYTYGPDYKQRIKDVSGQSVLAQNAIYKVRNHYDEDTGRLKAVIRSGYTSEFDPAQGTWAPELRHIGVFYRDHYTCTVPGGFAQTGYGDAKGRIVEVAGPCAVGHLDAQQCSTSQYSQSPIPMTQYEYWPETASPRLAGRLAVRRVFSRISGDGTCTSPGGVDPKSYLETRFEDYDEYGQLTQMRDANGVVTKFIYAGNVLVETRVADGTPLVSVTKYGYDTGSGSGNWVQHPDGRYEVQCFRAGTTLGSGCVGGTLTDKLQWKATAPYPNGTLYSERLDYSYSGDGKLVGETVRDRHGMVRHQRYYEGDPLGRLTYEAVGSAVPALPSDNRYHQVSLFDGAGNRVGIGAAYQPTSSPLEPLCGGFTPDSNRRHARPASPLCTAFEYDRLNRLSRMMHPEDDTQSEASVTCMSYDAQGNLASVGRADASGACLPAAQHSIRYAYDDFGRLIRVTAPWGTGAGGDPGVYRYGYDTAGNLMFKQTPAMTQESPVKWERTYHDALGRVLRVDVVRADSPNAPQTLYSFGYDDQVVPPPYCPGGTVNPDGPPNVKGRPQVLTDSFGDTWYAYDVHGRPRTHWRVRAQPNQPSRTLDCGRKNDVNHPNRLFYYDASGRLINEVLPGGRPLTYIYHSQSSGMPHRVAEVRAVSWDGERWGSTMTVLKDAQWEPYGGLRSYALNTHLDSSSGSSSWRYVDYLRTAPASVPMSRCNETNIVAGSDFTGRLKALAVSTEAERDAGRYGDIFKRVYTWKADHLVREDTCILETSDVAPETTQYAGAQGEAGFDARGQLRHVSGRPRDMRQYTYDVDGNRTRERQGDFVFLLDYPGDRKGLLRVRRRYACAGGTACSTIVSLNGPVESYQYDADGRVVKKQWADLKNFVGLGEWTFGTALDVPNPALGAVYRSVSDGARTWEYFYDAMGRRRLKLHASGVAEEYFYDGTILLEDWSVTSLVSSSADSIRDEYLWLGGRPVALFKTRVIHGGGRVADFSGECGRHGDDIAPNCGVYYPIFDEIGKPVLMLDGAGLVTGVGDYDAFGHVNRIAQLAESSHPVVLDGEHVQLAESVGLPAPKPGLNVNVRARVGVVRVGDRGAVYLTDDSNVRIQNSSLDGDAGLGAVTPWVDLAGISKVRVHYGEQNVRPGGPIDETAWGVSLDGFEYRRFQTGASPVWTPLRFPGQYHDAETDLFENWNRYYDAAIGRYFGPDPMLQDPAYALNAAQQGMSVPAYAYAHNNPTYYTDSSGKAVPLLLGLACVGGGCEAAVAAAAVGATIATAYIAAKVMPYLSEGGEEGATPTLGESIGNGHAQDKHEQEFEEIDIAREDLPRFIDDIVEAAKVTEGRVIHLPDDRTAYLDPATETVVIHDPKHPDLGTAMRPKNPRTGESTYKRYVRKLREESR
ncbi:RHS repeat-associated core domain-containing protein [Myxococcus sp. Y35]|uniref:RHS repeat-associated core domain-containing protein n=1 Tax=Pseudomyxococcus flavus TaxID=3115648 RepID=UPI003CF4C696